MAESAIESSVDVWIKKIPLRWARSGLMSGAVFGVILVVNYFRFPAGRPGEYSPLQVFTVIPIYGALGALVFFLAGLPVRMWLRRQCPDPAQSDDYKAVYLRREAERLPGNWAAFVGFCGVVVFVLLLAHAGVESPHFNSSFYSGRNNGLVDAFEFIVGICWLLIGHLSLSVASVFAPAVAAYLTGLVFRHGLSRAIAEDFRPNGRIDKP